MVTVVALLGMVLGAATLVYLLGLNRGEANGQAAVTRVRLQAADAERRMHEMTLQALIALAEAVQDSRQRQPDAPR